jgi:hypothetical protein
MLLEKRPIWGSFCLLELLEKQKLGKASLIREREEAQRAKH